MAWSLDRLRQVLGDSTEGTGLGYAGSEASPELLQYAQDVLSGKIASQGVLNRPAYDPDKPFFAQTGPERGQNWVQEALDVALGIGPGSFVNKRADYTKVPSTPAPSYWDLPPRVAQREQAAALRSALPSPNIGLGTAGPLFDLSRLADHPGVTHSVQQIDLPRLIPPKGTPQRYIDMMSNPATRARVEAAFEYGIKNGGQEWLNMMPVRDAFQEIASHYGPGPQFGLNRFDSLAKHIGTSTSGSKPPQNVKMGSYWDYLAEHGDPLPTKAQLQSKDPGTRLSLPPGYGSPEQGLHAAMAADVRQRGVPWGLDSTVNPKPPSFTANINGNYRPIMIDQVMSGPKVLDIKTQSGTPLKAPENRGYGYTEGKLQDWAADHWLDPAPFQASVWIGANPNKPEYSIPLAKIFEDKVRQAAAKRKLTPWQALVEMVMAERPLSIGAGLLGGSTLAGGLDGIMGDAELPR